MTLPLRMAEALPPGIPVQLPGRGSMRVHDTGGSSDEPALLLLHGWNIDGATNWANALPALSSDHRVVLVDHHGHGHGVRPAGGFRLEHCAIDALAALDKLGVDRFVAVGYSLGGAVAQILARRNPERCVGLVAMASAGCWSTTPRERAEFAALRVAAQAARRTPNRMLDPVANRIVKTACSRYPEWILEVVQTADAVALLEAGAELGRFNSDSWANTLRLPAAVIVTDEDVIVAPTKQERLASALPYVRVFHVAAGHDLPLQDDERFGATVRTAVDSVLTRVGECQPSASRPRIPEASGPSPRFSSLRS